MIIVAIDDTKELKQELRFYLSQGNKLQLAESYPGNWIGDDGTVISSEFSLNEQGSLDITSGNMGWGSGQWSETRTIAYRGGQFIVAGFTYGGYDKHNQDKGVRCEVNLLTGNGTLNHSGVVDPSKQKTFKTTAKPIPFKDWNDSEHRPRECPNTID